VRDNFSKANEATLSGPADFFGTKTTVRAMYLSNPGAQRRAYGAVRRLRPHERHRAAMVAI